MGRLLPALLLLAYGAAFAVVAVGGGLPVFDDHPGQYLRLWHALERSVPAAAWTADWNPDWWGGYPELQFYPPGFAIAGAAIRLLGLWRPSVELTYQLLCSLVLLLPGLATYALMRGVLGNGWLALPPAFLALTLSAGLRGGVEESLRWGTLTSRLSMGLLPLLALALKPWVETGRAPLGAALTLAAVVLAHPASAPAALTMIALAALLRLVLRPERAPLVEAAGAVTLGVTLTGFWTLPLVLRHAWVVPLAWGESTLPGLLAEIGMRPISLALGVTALTAWGAVWWRRRPFDALLAALPLVLLGTLAADVLLFRLGWSAIEPARLADGVALATLWAAGLGLGVLITASAGKRRARPPGPLPALGLVCLAALAFGRGAGEPDLTLWPHRAGWPRLAEVSRDHDLPRLWDALRQGSDRVLFVTSALKLDATPAWYAPHSHVLGLAPLFAGREIVGGTFTHPSPLAARFYTGAPVPPPRLETLAEQLDGQRLLGQPFHRLSPETFDAFARRLRIATVVVPLPEVPRAAFLADRYLPAAEAAGFAVFERRDRPWPQVERITHRRYRVLVSPAGGVWVPTGIAAYPLWQAKSGHGALETRADPWGLLELRVPLNVWEAELVYGEGWLEWGGLGVTVIAAALWLRWAWRARRRGRPAKPAARPSALLRRARR